MIPFRPSLFPRVLRSTSILLLMLLVFFVPAGKSHAASHLSAQATVPANGIPTLYLADADDDDHNRETLYAIDASIGSTRWFFTPTLLNLPQTPFAGFGNVYLDDFGSSAAFTAENGAPMWTQTDPPHTETTAVGFSGMVLAGGRNTFSARNASTGAVVWQSSLSNFNPSRGVIATVEGKSRVYFGGCCTDNVYALDAATGTPFWQRHLGSTNASVTAPAVDASLGLVYVASSDGQVYALDARNGGVAWTFFAAADLEGAPRVAGGVVYVGAENGKFYALDASSGHVRWTFSGGKRLRATPAVANNLVYFSDFDTGTVYALNATTGGSPVWTFHPTFTSISPIGLTVTNGQLYEAVVSFPPSPRSQTISVYAINASTGVNTWRWDGFSGGSLFGEAAPPVVAV